MYLSNLKLWNFRAFGSDAAFSINAPNLDLGFNSGLNVLIGENDSGKSAIIDSIRHVLKTHSYDWIRIDGDDFHIHAGHSSKIACRLEVPRSVAKINGLR